MSNKKFILNADDFGMSKSFNSAVLGGYNEGFLTSASLCANGKAFNAAVNEILPECPNLGVGVHLNIIEGKALTKNSTLTNKHGRFKRGFLGLLLNSNKCDFLNDVEREFRAQIEQVKKHTNIDHLDSHVHVHAIPNIFEITVKLAKEYDIPYVRTQYEEMYFVHNVRKYLNFRYPVNLIKIALLNTFTHKNKKHAAVNGIRTNDYLVGVGFTGMMDSETVRCGVEAIETDGVVEVLIHPALSFDGIKNRHLIEYRITQDKELENSIKQLGYEITNYKNL